MLERAFEIVPREEIFAHTGLQFMQFNTLYQLLAMKLQNSAILESAESLLMMPDLFHWLLTGVKANEMTERHHDAVLQSSETNWATDLLNRFGLPTRILGNVVQPGTRLGPILPKVAKSDRPGVGASGRARNARYGQRRDGRARGEQAGRAARLVLHQLRHVVADGRGSAAAGHQRPSV